MLARDASQLVEKAGAIDRAHTLVAWRETRNFGLALYRTMGISKRLARYIRGAIAQATLVASLAIPLPAAAALPVAAPAASLSWLCPSDVAFDVIPSDQDHEDEGKVPRGLRLPFGLQEDSPFSLSGIVEGVDYSANVIRLRTRLGLVVPIAVTPTTAIEVGGQSGSIADIRPGARLTVSGKVLEGALAALSITVRR